MKFSCISSSTTKQQKEPKQSKLTMVQIIRHKSNVEKDNTRIYRKVKSLPLRQRLLRLRWLYRRNQRRKRQRNRGCSLSYKLAAIDGRILKRSFRRGGSKSSRLKLGLREGMARRGGSEERGGP